MALNPNFDTILLIKRTTSIFFLLGIFMSIDLWGVERTFPILPVFTFLKTGAILANKVAFSILISSLISIILFERKASLYLLFSSLLYLLIEDQIRWQPWVYIYIVILLPFFLNTSKKEKLIFLRILFIGI